jgi:hypothetical protein
MQKPKQDVYALYLSRLASLSWRSYEEFVKTKMQQDSSLNKYVEKEEEIVFEKGVKLENNRKS